MVNFQYQGFWWALQHIFSKQTKKAHHRSVSLFAYPASLHSWDIYMANITYETHKSFEKIFKLLANTNKHLIISIVVFRLFLLA